ncbi:MAG: hypothetical protein HY028_05325 [Gammaproteobacteria bacterium]|nr:hypothetical protein [Gammaproteobacteria bacterium]
MAVPPQASAASCTWNPATGNWSTASDWSCGIVPASTDTANIGASKVVTITSGQSILTLGNSGGVNIDAFGLNLVGGGSTVNTGTINVGGASTANLGVSAGHNINNAGGVINIAVGSVVNQFGSTITGGTINTTGTGALVAFNSSSNFLNGVTLNGSLDLATNTGIERVSSGLTLNGAINVNNNSILAFEGDQTVSGTGTITLGNTGGGNRVNLEAGNLVLGSGITLHGQNGTIGNQSFIGGPATLTNNGTISADVSGGLITLAVNGLTTNNATLSAQNGGTLQLNSAVTNAGSGHIDAIGAGSQVVQNGVTVSGGAINTTGGGVLAPTNNGNNFLNSATLNGTLDLATGTGIERLGGSGLTMVSGSAININGNSILTLEGSAGLSGTGAIVLGATGGSNRINLENIGTSTIATGILIHGQNGTIGQQSFIGGAPHDLVNNGTISADVAGGTINLTPNGGTTNNGTLSAQSGGTLLLSTNVVGNVGSQIIAGAGSAVVQNGVTISGVINTSGTGSFNATNSGGNFLDGVTFSGTLDLATATGEEQVKNGLTLNGAINVNNNSILAFEGNQTVSGTGTIRAERHHRQSEFQRRSRHPDQQRHHLG